ncbi:MAG: hypothetical protein JOZ16_02645 [Methylobacteriaceae bacterium]|nr:hypothetical protein [Methylobacteriaceae bacterium]
MPRKALVVSVSSLAVAACALASLALLRGTGALAEPAASYPSVSTQLFDATPIGGEARTLAPHSGSRQASDINQSVKAQIFDPEVFGGVRSKFSGTRAVVGNSDGSQSTIEGRSVGLPLQVAPVSAPVRKMSPAPQECEPRPSARTLEPQIGSLEQNYLAG